MSWSIWWFCLLGNMLASVLCWAFPLCNSQTCLIILRASGKKNWSGHGADPRTWWSGTQSQPHSTQFLTMPGLTHTLQHLAPACPWVFSVAVPTWAGQEDMEGDGQGPPHVYRVKHVSSRGRLSVRWNTTVRVLRIVWYGIWRWIRVLDFSPDTDSAIK